VEDTGGDIIFFRSIPGKWVFSMAHMAKRACDMAGIKKE